MNFAGVGVRCQVISETSRILRVRPVPGGFQQHRPAEVVAGTAEVDLRGPAPAQVRSLASKDTIE